MRLFLSFFVVSAEAKFSWERPLLETGCFYIRTESINSDRVRKIIFRNCKKLLSDAVKSPSSTTTISSSVQLPDDVDLMILEVENLIQSMVKDQLDDFSYSETSLENETRSLYHQLGQSAPVFIQN